MKKEKEKKASLLDFFSKGSRRKTPFNKFLFSLA